MRLSHVMLGSFVSISMFLSAGVLAAPPSDGSWTKIWADEFNSVPAECSGTSLDCTKWDVSWDKYRGAQGSLQWWHKAQPNANIANGVLRHTYKKESNNSFTSGYATTHQIFGTTYGYFEARIKVTELDKSTVQTAFWMMPFNNGGGLIPNNTKNNSANDGAEIDIFESKNLQSDFSAGLMCDNYASWPNICADTRDDTIYAPGFRNGFHNIGLNWTPTKMEIFYDGNMVHSITHPSRIVHVPERLILSGGIGSENINNLMSVGQQDNTGQIDWVRVHKNNQMDWGNQNSYYLTNLYSDVFLSASGSGVFNLSNHAYILHAWRILKQPDNTYQIYHINQGECLGVEGQSTAGAARAELQTCGNVSTHWAVEFDSNNNGIDYYRIRNANSGKYLSLNSLNSMDGEPIKQAWWWDGKPQKWALSWANDRVND